MDIAIESPSLITGIRIELPFEDIPDVRRDSNRKECYLVLFEKHMEYKVVADYTDLDTADGLPTVKKANYRWTRKRNAISDIDMIYDSKVQLYSIGLDFNGINDHGMNWSFNTGKEAKVIYDQLQKYFIDGL